MFQNTIKKYDRWIFFINLIVLIFVLFLTLSVGTVKVPIPSVVKLLLNKLPIISIPQTWTNAHATIIFKLRLPHILMTMLVGSALAGSGTLYQGLFRNPLADSYLLGVSSGAGLGTVLAILLTNYYNLGEYIFPIFAFIGGLGSILLVYNLAKINNYVPLTPLILAGIAVSTLTSSITSFILLFLDSDLKPAVTFLFGGTHNATWQTLLITLPYFLISIIIFSFLGHALNVLQFGEEQAKQMGINVELVKRLILITTSIASAAAVAFYGIVGFVGLIVPHIIRIIFSSNYKIIIKYSILNGGIVLLIADLLSRTLLSPQIIPTGIITSILGAPFFIFILLSAKKKVIW